MDVVPLSSSSALESITESILQTCDPWDSPGQAAREAIQWFEPSLAKVHWDEDEMLSLYPTPQPSKFKMSDAVTQSRLTRENYKARLHALLYIEEMSQYKVNIEYHLVTLLQLWSINIKFDRNFSACQFHKVFSVWFTIYDCLNCRPLRHSMLLSKFIWPKTIWFLRPPPMQALRNTQDPENCSAE